MAEDGPAVVPAAPQGDRDVAGRQQGHSLSGLQCRVLLHTQKGGQSYVSDSEGLSLCFFVVLTGFVFIMCAILLWCP